MGGKRPDQYRIDPPATDRKFHPQQEQAVEQDQRYSEEMESRTRKGQPTPPNAPEPEAERRRERAKSKAIRRGKKETA